jgi:hypothetical protein
LERFIEHFEVLDSDDDDGTEMHRDISGRLSLDQLRLGGPQPPGLGFDPGLKGGLQSNRYRRSGLRMLVFFHNSMSLDPLTPIFRGVVEIEELLFGEASQLLVDPAEKRLKSELQGVKRSLIPIHAVIRSDEV